MKRFVFPFLSLIALIPAVSRAEEIFSVDKNTVLRIEQDCTLTFNVNYKSEKSRFAAYSQNPYYRYAPKIEKKDSSFTATARMKKSGLPDSRIVYRRISPTEWEAEYLLEYPEKFQLNFAAVELALPIR